jgi:hypothetical protein
LTQLLEDHAGRHDHQDGGQRQGERAGPRAPLGVASWGKRSQRFAYERQLALGIWVASGRHRRFHRCCLLCVEAASKDVPYSTIQWRGYLGWKEM